MHIHPAYPTLAALSREDAADVAYYHAWRANQRVADILLKAADAIAKEDPAVYSMSPWGSFADIVSMLRSDLAPDFSPTAMRGLEEYANDRADDAAFAGRIS